MVTRAKKFTELYSTVYQDLYRFALCMMRQPEDAEDAVSEAVMAAYENIHSLRKEEAFRPWIFQITANVCKKKLKERSIREEELLEEYAATEDHIELQIDIQNALLLLDDEEKCIMALSAFGGYNSKEIGEMLDMNPNTVRSKRKRAVDKISLVIRD